MESNVKINIDANGNIQREVVAECPKVSKSNNLIKRFFECLKVTTTEPKSS